MIDFLVNILLYVLAFLMWAGLISWIIMIPVWIIEAIIGGFDYTEKNYKHQITDRFK